MTTARQIAVADVVLSVFENGRVAPKFDSVATHADGPGGVRQITYGYHQGTDASNTLDKIVEDFVARLTDSVPVRAAQNFLRPYVAQMRSNNPTVMRRLAADKNLVRVLREAGAYPEMQAAQVKVFHENYMDEAVEAVEGSNWSETLSLVAVVDGLTHGSFARIRDQVSPRLTERNWVLSYLLRRNRWLREHSRQLLRNTASRSASLIALARAGNWNLDTPFVLDLGHRGKVTVRECDLEAFYGK